MRWEQPVQYAALSDIGFRRQNNQDSVAARVCSEQSQFAEHGHLFLVADGMGGHAVGELASKIAADTIPHTFFKSRETNLPEALRAAIVTANNTIHERGSLNRDFERMGTTCSVLVLAPDGAIIGHVGDSRVYRIRGDRIDQLSFDHSLQWELIRQGRMKPEEVFLQEPRHVITRSLGPEPIVNVDIEGPYAILPGDVYILCSDGLVAHVADPEIGTIAAELAPGDACRMLVNLANLRGGSDNVSVVVVRVAGAIDGVTAHEPEERPLKRSAMNWFWLVSVWVLAILFVVGVCLSLFGLFLEGLVAVAAAAFAGVGLFAYWLEKRPKTEADEGNPDLAETKVWRPYRTASAKFNRRFLSHLAAIESELQRAATDEGWSINWESHESAYRSAKQALDQRQYAQAFADFAKVIDILMVGLHLFRKQASREAKWGRSAPPAPAAKSKP